jgi:1,2-phenylacetyl-CoA epoxidase catalytic subunit
MSDEPLDLHQLEPARFFERVHSFEFWFEAVEGYLHGLDHGHRPETPDVELPADERERLITILCNYCIGETAALEGAGGLVQIAPNRATKIFLATQTVDEGRHLEVLVHRLRELGVADPELEIANRATPALLEFKRRLLSLVRERDWLAALFAQNVILEAMEFTVFQAHARTADPRTREVLQGIVKDERRHMGFGENELGRRLAAEPRAARRLAAIRRDLDPLVIDSFRDTLTRLGRRRDDGVDLAEHYRAAVSRLGFA